MRARKRWFEEGLAAAARRRWRPDQRLLVEYKPFEPAFYHTDIADWGMALQFAKAAGPQARVLVDTGHHYASQNIEQIVAWLLAEGMLGGFHFNDRRYADDDLTLGSIDPYQVFRIFHEIRFFEWETGAAADIAYVIDQSHNLKGKIESMIQTVTQAQALVAKAALVECEALASRAAGQRPGEGGVLPAGRLRLRRPAGDRRVARGARSASRSDGRIPAERLSRAHHQGAMPGAPSPDGSSVRLIPWRHHCSRPLGITKAFAGVRALVRRLVRRAPRRSACAGRGERRRQVDADQDHDRRRDTGRRPADRRRPRHRAHGSRSVARAGNRRHLSAAVAVSRSHGHRKHRLVARDRIAVAADRLARAAGDEPSRFSRAPAARRSIPRASPRR